MHSITPTQMDLLSSTKTMNLFTLTDLDPLTDIIEMTRGVMNPNAHELKRNKGLSRRIPFHHVNTARTHPYLALYRTSGYSSTRP